MKTMKWPFCTVGCCRQYCYSHDEANYSIIYACNYSNLSWLCVFELSRGSSSQSNYNSNKETDRQSEEHQQEVAWDDGAGHGSVLLVEAGAVAVGAKPIYYVIKCLVAAVRLAICVSCLAALRSFRLPQKANTKHRMHSKRGPFVTD